MHATPRFDYDDWSDLDDTQALWHNILATRLMVGIGLTPSQ